MLVLICNPTTNFDSSSQATSLPRDANLSAETSLRAELDAAVRASSAIFQAMHMLTHPSSEAKRNFDGDIYPKKKLYISPMIIGSIPNFLPQILCCSASAERPQRLLSSEPSTGVALGFGSTLGVGRAEDLGASLRLGENDLRPPWNSLDIKIRAGKGTPQALNSHHLCNP